MRIVALCAWAVTAAAGLYLLGTWVVEGGVRRVQHGPGRHRRFPPILVFGHFLLAVGGLVTWIVFVVTQHSMLAWAGFATLLLVATMGLAMFVRWVPGYRAKHRSGRLGAAHREPPERHLPPTVVFGHGVMAVTTVVLVLLTAIGVDS
ncbi:MAG: hypothetical protein L0H84_08760 [Pseudonocardia sp.]|nr:hypothetical protein [Pseudonocardia sp.]